eukprot:GHRQ01020384.1.p1 GENE.GHRQ01020384.1~~GHRQ01020384.1.p1  ORF type:complete len:185 (-),score=12.24 GHRQ01020384.1:579-1133(-)
MARKAMHVGLQPGPVQSPCDAAKARKKAPDSSCPAVQQACRTLAAAKEETRHYAAGLLAFGGGCQCATPNAELCIACCVAPVTLCFRYAGLLFAAGAAAWSLPLLFVVFTAVCMPWRAVSFYRQKWVSKQQTQRFSQNTRSKATVVEPCLRLRHAHAQHLSFCLKGVRNIPQIANCTEHLFQSS